MKFKIKIKSISDLKYCFGYIKIYIEIQPIQFIKTRFIHQFTNCPFLLLLNPKKRRKKKDFKKISNFILIIKIVFFGKIFTF